MLDRVIDRSDSIDRICARRSVAPRFLEEPAPSTEEIREIVRAACSGVDHGRLAPTRFVYVPDDMRSSVAEAFEAATIEAEPNATEKQIAVARERAMAGPCLIGVTARIDDTNAQVPAHEQWIAVGAALQNLMLAADAIGFHGKIVSGKRVRSNALRALFRLAEDEHLVGFVALGTNNQPLKDRPRRSPDEILSVLEPA